MARPGPWSVKGVDDDARQIAREAAFREGLTIGAWVDRAIRARTGNLPGDRATATAQPGSEAAAPETVAPIHPSPAHSEDGMGTPDFQATSAPPAIDRPIEPVEVEPVEATPTESAAADNSAPKARPEPFPTAPSPDDRIRDLPKIDPVVAAQANAARRPRGLPRSALAAGALIVVGGLGVWTYSTIGPDRAAPSRDQVASASRPPEQKEATKPAVAPEVATRQSTSRAALLLASAQNGDARAQFDLGVLHMRGDEVARDPALAAGWFEKAAKNGLATAQYNLGTMLLSGTGVTKDEKTAYFWFQSAAEQGHPRAQYNLGAMYLSERGGAARLRQGC